MEMIQNLPFLSNIFQHFHFILIEIDRDDFFRLERFIRIEHIEFSPPLPLRISIL